MKSIRVEIAAGELVDKITILLIKQARIKDPAKLKNIETELRSLEATREETIPQSKELERLTADLRKVNEELWDIEDAIRRCEAAADFGPRFVELARSVYHQNDRRSILKRQINDLLGSTIVEEKSYEKYTR